MRPQLEKPEKVIPTHKINTINYSHESDSAIKHIKREEQILGKLKKAGNSCDEDQNHATINFNNVNSNVENHFSIDLGAKKNSAFNSLRNECLNANNANNNNAHRNNERNNETPNPNASRHNNYPNGNYANTYNNQNQKLSN